MRPRLDGSALGPALWIGLVGGGLEAGIVAWRRFVDGKLVFVVSDYWWLAPVVTALLIAITTLLFVSITPLRFPRIRDRIGFGVPLFLAALGIVLLFSAVSDIAAVILALGLGIQGSAWLASRAAGFKRLIRHTLPVLALLPLLGGAAIRAAPGIRSQGSAPSDLPENTPNILLIVLDTVRAIELGLYGLMPSTSPNLDGFAQEGVVFEQAFSTAPWTAPSHASLFTGRNAGELSIDWERPLDRRFPTLAEVLRDAGYATVGVTANRYYTSLETGLARGFDRYEDSHLNLERALLLPRLTREAVAAWRKLANAPEAVDLSRVRAERINRQFLRWAAGRQPRPFFAFLNYFDAHAPYRAPEPHWSRFVSEKLPDGMTLSSSQARMQRKAYQAAISHLDEQLGRLLNDLLVGGVLENTLVIITADHGEEFMEHGVIGHGHSLYSQSVRVPLIMVWPGHLPAGVRVREPVSLDRVAATILDLIGRPGPFTGPSLVGHWRGQPVPPVAIRANVSLARNSKSPFGAWGPLASVQLGTNRYIYRIRDATGQLYDHRTDPLETRNLAGEAGAGPLVMQLRDSLGMED